MKKLLFSFVLCAVPAFAQAPASIGDKVYRESTLVVSTRTSTERTIVFGADGRFSSLKAGSGSALVPNAPFKIFLTNPRADGSYTYTRTGAATATLDLAFNDGTREIKSLTFTTPDRGGDEDSIVYYLSDLAAARSNPASNISMRGQVGPGHPLIVGFVVPGDSSAAAPNVFLPPPGIAPREVLIRVVGPSLAAFGVTGTWADPDFQLYRGPTPAPVAESHYADWSLAPSSTNPPVPSATTEAAFRKIFASPLVGAFPLLSNSKDAADVVRLNPGAYTIVCSAAAGDAGGEALVEVYFLP